MVKLPKSKPGPEPLRPSQATFVFEQEKDSCDSNDYFGQTLTVETCDAGAGPYLILKTERLAIDLEDIDQLVETLRWCLAQVKQ